VYVQAESEVAAINMVYGPPGRGARSDFVLQPRHQPDAGGHLVYRRGGVAGVLVNIMRAGPGLAACSPSQADYFQATKGGGHGTITCWSSLPPTSRSGRSHPIGLRPRRPLSQPGDVLATG